MIFVRSIILNTMIFALVAFVILSFWVLLPFPRHVMCTALRCWNSCNLWLIKKIARLSYEVRGVENISDKPVIFAVKHQSVWETTVFFLLVECPGYVVKKELMDLPLYGHYLRKAGLISVDRKGEMAALRKMIREAKTIVEEGRQVVIFPEGTRSTPGVKSTYYPGVAALYKALDVPVVPVALNSGVFWRRRSFIKRPGTILIEFLDPIAPGLKTREFMELLEQKIEAASTRLMAEGEAARRSDKAA
jgi:1-acyl-sn-glycerol-3-phosphate acyltransferase